MFDELINDPASFQPLPPHSTPFYLYHGSAASLSVGMKLNPRTGYNSALREEGRYVYAAHQWDYAMIFGLRPYVQRIFFSQEIDGRRHQILLFKPSFSKEFSDDPIEGLVDRKMSLVKLESANFQPVMVYSFYTPQTEPAEWISHRRVPFVDSCIYSARDLVTKAGIQVFTYPAETTLGYGLSFERMRRVNFQKLMEYVQKGHLLWENGRLTYDDVPNARPASFVHLSHKGLPRDIG